MPATEIASILNTETERLAQLLRTISFGDVGVRFILHHGRISRIVRILDISTRPSEGQGGRA